MAALLANPRTSGSSATNGGRESRQVLVRYFDCVHKRLCLLFRKDLGEAFTVQDATPGKYPFDACDFLCDGELVDPASLAGR